MGPTSGYPMAGPQDLVMYIYMS